MSTLANRYQKILSEIPQGTLIAVSKTHPATAIKELYDLGQRDFGENYAQELVEKATILHDLGCLDIRWHFIGHLQSNKVAAVLPWVYAVHSVDSVKLAQKLSRGLGQNPKKDLPIFLEVNIDSEPTKSGFLPEQVPSAVAEMSGLSGLTIEGLMCIPDPHRNDLEQPYKKLAHLAIELGAKTRGALSMGMTQDYQTALKCGANYVRIGTALFGDRKR